MPPPPSLPHLFQGAKTLYRRLIHHKLVDNENQIDEIIGNAGQVGLGLMRKATTVVVSHASEGITTAAMRISRQEERSSHFVREGVEGIKGGRERTSSDPCTRGNAYVINALSIDGGFSLFL